MNIYIISIFPEIFAGFLQASLVGKAQDNWFLEIHLINPRDFCFDKHKQVDDEIYWWWSWMLLKAAPFIDAVESVLENIHWSFEIVYLAPSKKELNQKRVFEYSKKDNIILVCWRYEGIDYRFQRHMKSNHSKNYKVISIWKYITMWGETPAMVFVESVSRLLPWVIKEESSWLDESYNLEKDMKNIEYPQYTRPQEVYGMEVPEVLLSWNHEEIRKWREENEE